MSDTVIRVENLGKKYIIGHQKQERYTALRDVVSNQIKSLGSFIHPKSEVENPNVEEFWALKDVSFEIKQGDRVGIIGRNGAGKSTLLKILSRITEPTVGRIKIKGRVASLLEVGTGFHPELTGRENIFLNGAILGMSKVEIKRKFDEIVAFAEVEKFLDTPVKRYSSGMYVRLAFAVAAHLEPEILIVDEVLAVGDAAFQKKCLGKMEDVSKGEGRTVLFVSHNMGAINQLCEDAIWLDQGKLIVHQSTENVVSRYLTKNAHEGQFLSDNGIANVGVDEFKLLSISIKNIQGEVTSYIDFRQQFFIEIQYQINEYLPYCRVGFLLSTTDGITLFESYDTDGHNLKTPRQPGKYIIKCKIPEKLLKPGQYILTFNAGIPSVKNLVSLESLIKINIEDTSGDSLSLNIKRKGIIFPALNWESVG
ncbi:ABC transporter ATP-binding protein [Anabaena sp. UHCC 0451]|uniref:ABC transporter ATP-binding protein n=1 Tax=Anabaena sp. UHCC 0451 TaxID=2055235 RepID=UPI002B20AD9A|nr:ABC transporter ATP-binding protein [Anabaena sp. UHCC 0451]MEA5575025.1 ABC transporter ATP-binding protein [Anabaena sp. UHCC 0451]